MARAAPALCVALYVAAFGFGCSSDDGGQAGLAGDVGGDLDAAFDTDVGQDATSGDIDSTGHDTELASDTLSEIDISIDRRPYVFMDFYRSSSFYDAPFPCESLRQPDGTIDLSAFPNPERIEFVDELLALAGQSPGFGTTSTIYFRVSEPLDPTSLPSIFESVEASASAYLVPIPDGEDAPGELHPIDMRFLEDVGPFGAPNLLAMLPYQGFPLEPSTRYAAIVTTDVESSAGRAIERSPVLDRVGSGERVEGLTTEAAADYRAALDALGDDAVARVAALAVFRTQDPVTPFVTATHAVQEREPLRWTEPPILAEEWPSYCVYRGAVTAPVFQGGSPPYDTGGGDWRYADDGTLSLQRRAPANVWLTVPRVEMPARGYPIVTFVRTGGGGDRPLIDRGVRTEAGEPAEPGSGLATHFAQIGWAGVSVDGPHGGLRNPAGRDEQLLIFNLQNPVAMRDNIRQSALELALVPALLDEVALDLSGCEGAFADDGGPGRFDPDRQALLGHSMGATIAPLTAAAQPRYGALVLSGAGGSWIHNIVFKQSPFEARPVAELILRYPSGALTTHDPALTLLQWTGESADPPVYAQHVVHAPLERSAPRHVLMFQGITDTYILPPMANALSLALGIDLAGGGLEDQDAASARFEPLAPLLALSRRRVVEYPVSANIETRSGAVTGVVSQHLEGPIEDGHEVMFQLEEPKQQLRGFLDSWGPSAPVVER